jgi:hypothetical protein
MASPNEEIKTSAEGAALVFSRLADLHQKSIAEHKALIDAVAEGKLKPGSVLERQVELAALYDETWKFLIPVVAEGYAAVVEVEPTTGRTSRLSLTRAQRDEILQKRGTGHDERAPTASAGSARGDRGGQIRSAAMSR